ncbi:MAG: DSBA oxidoreductase [Parcubacteria group bacterium Gr01-1014_66]|nr:MAG: DSBA oxidoreductase [Parcubacteria group bacterium Gr01-1014_66]
MEDTNSSSSNTLLVPAAIVVAGILIAGAVIYTSGPRQSGTEVAGAGKAVEKQEEGRPDPGELADDDPSLGSPDAPVTIVEFGDFQCPFCADFLIKTEGKLRDSYIKNGKVRLIYRDFPITEIHAVAQKAAEASECADDQGKFWEYHDFLYAHQKELSPANLKVWAGDLNLNMTQFSSCLDSGKYTDEVTADRASGIKFGVKGTPSFFVNGTNIPGFVEFPDLEQVIQSALQ